MPPNDPSRTQRLGDIERALGVSRVMLALSLAACGGVPSSPATARAPAVASASSAPPLIAAPTPTVDAFTHLDATETSVIFRSHLAGPTRVPVAPIAFQIDALPTGAVPDPIVAASTDLPPGEAAGLVVDWASLSPEAKISRARHGNVWVRVKVPGAAFGRLRMGDRESPITPDAGSGTFVTCGGDTPTRTIAMRIETFAFPANAAAEYVVADGLFDPRTCAGVVTRRTRIQIAPLAGGILYAFREQCSTCSSSDAVHVLGPHATQLVVTGLGSSAASSSTGSFSAAVLPVRRGGGVALVAGMARSSIKLWSDATNYHASSESDLVVGVEIVQGVADDKPSAIVYVADPVKPSTTPKPPQIEAF